MRTTRLLPYLPACTAWGCTWSGGCTWYGGIPGPGGCTWSLGGISGPGGVPSQGGVPGPKGFTWSVGGVPILMSEGVPGPRGCTCSGAVPAQPLPLWTETRVKRSPSQTSFAGGNNVKPALSLNNIPLKFFLYTNVKQRYKT